MILTHPFLFYTIVALFIAFTAAWVVFVIISGQINVFKNKLHLLETENRALRLHIKTQEEQLQRKHTYPFNNTPVISLPASIKATKKN